LLVYESSLCLCHGRFARGALDDPHIVILRIVVQGGEQGILG